MSGVTGTEFTLVFQTNKSLQCTSHSVRVTEVSFVFQTNKSLAVTELGFVFYTKNIKDKLTLKNFFALVSSLYSYFLLSKN